MKKYRLALITGASTGLGRALAEALALRGIPLILTARREDVLLKVADSLPVQAQVYALDLNQKAERQKFLTWIQSQQPDLIINNAGAGLYGPALAHPSQKQLDLIELNISALSEITLECARILIKQKRCGTILNISSAAAYFCYPTNCVYAASKSFVNHFSEALDFELKGHGVRVLVSCPGQIDTEFSSRAGGGTAHMKEKKLTMSTQKAARLILKQIDGLKPIEIIDWKYKLLVALSRIIPKRLLMRYLSTTLKNRHKHDLHFLDLQE